MRNCTRPCSTRGAARGVLLWSRDMAPAGMGSRSRPTGGSRDGDEKPATAGITSAVLGWARAAGTPYPVVRQGSPMIQPGHRETGSGGCSAVLPLAMENSPNSASMSAHESCAARSPKSPRRAPDRCPHLRGLPTARPRPGARHPLNSGGETWKEMMTRGGFARGKEKLCPVHPLHVVTRLDRVTHAIPPRQALSSRQAERPWRGSPGQALRRPR